MAQADYKQARKNMVDGQIHTNGVVSADILNAFETVQRELFVPTNMAHAAYRDENLALDGQGHFLLAPMTHAKMLQAADLKQDDVVLDIGIGFGYSAAILSPLVSTVVALGDDDEALKRAEQKWMDTGACNIVGVLSEDLSQGHKVNAPYDLILINGAVREVPEIILKQLSFCSGRLIALEKPDANAGLGQVVRYDCSGNGSWSRCVLFSAQSPYLRGFEPKKEIFTF